MSDLVCHGSRQLFRPTEAVVTTGTCVHRMTATTRRLLELPDSLGLPFLTGMAPNACAATRTCATLLRAAARAQWWSRATRRIFSTTTLHSMCAGIACKSRSLLASLLCIAPNHMMRLQATEQRYRSQVHNCLLLIYFFFVVKEVPSNTNFLFQNKFHQNYGYVHMLGLI